MRRTATWPGGQSATGTRSTRPAAPGFRAPPWASGIVRKVRTCADGYRAYVGSVNRGAKPCQLCPADTRGPSSRRHFLIFKAASVRVIVMIGKNARGIAMKRLVGALVTLLAFAAAAQAQTYPTRTITLLVGFPPGGPTDTLARILADGMKSTLGQSIGVETVSGASGPIRPGRRAPGPSAPAPVVHAPPDGYTIGIGNWTSHVGSPALYALDYDVFKDLQPIALLAASPLWILGTSGLRPKTASQLIAWLKGRTEPTTFATVGAGSAAHLAGLSFARAIGAQF